MQDKSQGWQRQPMVWLFLGVLALSLVGCAVMLWLALRSNDGLVADDYYKRGQEIGMELKRDHAARELGLSAQLLLGEDGQTLRLQMPGKETQLQLRLVHPTRAGLDRQVELRPEAPGLYLGRLNEPLPHQRWLVQLEDPSGHWRLRSEALLGPGRTALLQPPPR
ncbi:FixH family protein [Chitinimonas lacunae]|uniref:FixH family protein n=1 Tax=Chitinimonas lacunae TaxID=1963018 RepID=A0ABV8MQ10_9NEIS